MNRMTGRNAHEDRRDHRAGAATTRRRSPGMVEAGMDVARLNFAHGTPEEKAATAERVREAAEPRGSPGGGAPGPARPEAAHRPAEGRRTPS